MKKIVFLGDSITFASRSIYDGALGSGYAFMVACELEGKHIGEYECINAGENGHHILQMYSRVKRDVWNHSPDYVSILSGANDVEVDDGGYWGVSDEMFEMTYRKLIEDTYRYLPSVKFIIIEPYRYEPSYSEQIAKKAKIVEKIAKDLSIPYVKVNDKLIEAIEKYPEEMVLRDKVHPAPMGARIIAEEWLKVFEENYGV